MNTLSSIKLGVPYYSQRFDVKDPFWKPRSCGIVALAMAMLYCYQKNNKQCASGRILRPFWHGLREAEQKGRNLGTSRWRSENEPRSSIVYALSELINEGVSIGARDPLHGWVHDGLVVLAKRHGFKKSFRKEWPTKSFNNAKTQTQLLRYLVVMLKRGVPVLASMRFKSSGHLVLLTGYRYLGVRRVEGFFYHDPNSKSRKSGAHKFISTSEFLKKWKGRIIVVQ